MKEQGDVMQSRCRGGRLLGCHVYVYLVVTKKRSLVTTGLVTQAFTTTMYTLFKSLYAACGTFDLYAMCTNQ